MGKKLERHERRVLPGLWQLKRDTWIIRAQKREPRTGRKINKRKLLTGVTRAEAIEELEELRRDLANPDPDQQEVAEVKEPTSRESLETFAKSWLQTKIKRGDLSPLTIDRYALALDRLSSWLRKMPLDSIQPRDVEQWMMASKGKYLASTINSWLRVLRAALSDAVRWELLDRNPAQLARALKVEVNLEESNSLTPTEVALLLEKLREQSHTMHAVASTQAMTGTRWSEVTAFRWEDYDADARVLRIHRTVCKGELRSTTKTGRARVVGVPEMLAEVLKEHRRLLVEKQHSGLSSGLMFPSNAGTPLGASRISDALREACKKAGIKKRFTSHGFRRSLTDMLREANVDPVVAAAITGHETERMRRHYSTIRDRDAVDAGDRVARLLLPAAKESPVESPVESPGPEAEKKTGKAEA